MNLKWTWALVISFTLMTSVAGFAQEAPTPKVWDFFWLEVLGGAVGAGIGNELGGLVAEGICDGDSLTCGVLLGSPLGAVAGVWITGALNNVNGTLWLAPIGAMLGAATGVWGDLIFQIVIESNSPLWFTYAFSAMGAALGFSIGASMNQP